MTLPDCCGDCGCVGECIVAVDAEEDDEIGDEAEWGDFSWLSLCWVIRLAKIWVK